eukprot:jgi/Mesen1/1382/ME000013S00875
MDEMESTPIMDQAWKLLKESVVTYCGQPVGTLAACDPTDLTPLNYDQVFIRDFVPSAITFLLAGEPDIVRNFLLHTLQLQVRLLAVEASAIEGGAGNRGLMPASFKVRHVQMEDGNPGDFEEVLDPDFGESAIGRVAPVDSGLWWITLLRAYGKCTGDLSLQQRVDVQTGIKLILKVCLADHFDMFPTLITTDGPCMIDRRLGIHGHPLEIQRRNACQQFMKGICSDPVPSRSLISLLEAELTVPWSYHNGGSWPVLLWQFTAACIKMGRPELAERAIAVAEKRLMKDRWPEYYDTIAGRLIGKQARLHQTWSIAGFLAAKLLLKNPHAVSMLSADEDWDLLEATACLLKNNPRQKRRRSGNSVKISNPPF